MRATTLPMAAARSCPPDAHPHAPSPSEKNLDIAAPLNNNNKDDDDDDVVYEHCAADEAALPAIISLIECDLSEVYTIYTYKYFLNTCPSVSLVARLPSSSRIIGTIVCKLEMHGRSEPKTCRGYIGMLAVAQDFRRRGIGTDLVRNAINEMRRQNADEVVLETELSNKRALALYERLGFVRDKRLGRYYMNGSDAFRLKLYLK